ncbi:helix-turn-helix transcriptional regulator [Pandoraea nosoerga]|uniref:AraC family transcriptional regulator n=1 Tax=Pandoraea nosoerga TaxID=2508296 RepID=A0A5E4TVP8_9BURK|nr:MULTISPECIES: AraC family transcriptional regulator [Pandoraea]MBN4665012.1 helix-turn-helix transcriptional regulator [Pandoraea nosoerga]MBN4675272.1 helix-turn-helix transcriptional regulator [Pandoraea nosoerga]MBN4680755.1 helix-turn-helix transcriptional regulator [Pandoraea nosoerga]MBN4744759.1 helix-turn-helix transcriptional regulator [Pandoraea nosoerga]VVD91601.1 AraC family transcriptional regulator [Pandoraea nosoerga]
MSAPILELREYCPTENSDTHDFHQVVIGLSGRMAISLDGDAARYGRVGARNGVVIPAGMRHDYRGDGPNRQVVLDVPVRLAALTGAARAFACEAFFSLDASLLALARRIAAGVDAGRPLSETDPVVREWLDALMARLAPARHAQRTVRLDLARVDARLRADLAAPADTATLAREAGMSVRHFHECFVAMTGETPHRHLMRLRLARAAQRLASTDAALADIALDVGFNDQSALTHAFRRHFGQTPAAWRREQRSGQPAAEFHKPQAAPGR